MFNLDQDDKLKMKVQTYAESSDISLQAKLIFMWHNNFFHWMWRIALAGKSYWPSPIVYTWANRYQNFHLLHIFITVNYHMKQSFFLDADKKKNV